MLRKGHGRPKGYIMACPHPIMAALRDGDESFLRPQAKDAEARSTGVESPQEAAE